MTTRPPTGRMEVKLLRSPDLVGPISGAGQRQTIDDVRTSDQTSGADRTPGRGRRRQPSTDRSILDATIDLLREGGLEGATTANIARRSGFAKTTIYRRWPTRDALLLDAFRLTVEASLTELAAPGPADRRPTSAVHAVARHGQQLFDQPVVAAILPTLAGHALARTELGQRFRTAVLDPLRVAARARLVAAMARDEIRADIDLDLVVELAYGGLLFRRLSGDGRDATASAAMADLLLAGAATPASL